MYLYIFHYEEWLTLYNCSFYDTGSLPLEERQHKSAGMLTLLMFVVFELLYIPCLCVITGDSFRRLSCYKLMALLGLLDVTIMPLNMAFSAMAGSRDDECSAGAKPMPRRRGARSGQGTL
ncbi:hypothetical protein AAVH_16227 [Aphelenchoides avenae]|nr:hypothetical protein AAVH_16227 [Aphelenchus avenae]